MSHAIGSQRRASRRRMINKESAMTNIETAEVDMADFSINEMLEMQRKLQENYKGAWEPINAETGKNKLLWMIGEVGEVIDIVKKNGDHRAIEEAGLRNHLVEEMADVMMYYNDIMLCYDITAEELKHAYTEKFERNMTRWKH